MLERFSGFVGCLHRWESTLLWETGLDFGLSGWREEAYFKHSGFHCLFFFFSSQNARISSIIRCPVPVRLLIWKDARPPASHICKFSPINCDIVCQPWNKKSILEKRDALFFLRNFYGLVPAILINMRFGWIRVVWSSFTLFLAGAALIVTDYCCWICPCKTRGGNMSDHFFERIIAIRDGILVQHFGFHL